MRIKQRRAGSVNGGVTLITEEMGTMQSWAYFPQNIHGSCGWILVSFTFGIEVKFD